MKKFLLLFVSLMLAFTVAACNGTDDPDDGDLGDVERLVIYQNKVEIDAELSAYAEAWGNANNVIVEVRTCGGDACAYADNLQTEFLRAREPDIFVIEGLGQYLDFAEKIYDMTGADWIDDTDVPLVAPNGEIVGFPVNFEGWGMAFNRDILDEAGIDPDTLTSREGYAAAFATLEDMKDELGLDTVVSFTTQADMTWVTGLHNFNGYLSSGLDYNDDSVITDLLAGVAHRDRLEALADWVELLNMYTEESLLISGTYEEQVNSFKTGRAAFVHQGNWIDPQLIEDGGIDFEVGYAPHASGLGEVDSIFVAPPSYYVVNVDSTPERRDLAVQFLNDMALTEAGHKYMVEDANYVPAFNSVELLPTSPLSAEVTRWAQDGNIYAWWQNDMPTGFGMGEIGPIYSLFANGTIDKEQFIDALEEEIETLAD